MKTKTAEPTITPKNANSRWVAIDIIDSDTIIAEGKSPEEVSEKAKKTGKQFMLMFVPKQGETYIF
ncbi:MAG: DUF5678 domain-containing protein [Bacteroidota bacterium]